MSINQTGVNSNNSTASAPDRQNMVNTGVMGREAPATILNRRDVEDEQQSAIQAEREWLAKVSEPGSTLPEANNKIRLVSTLVDSGTIQGTINTGIETVTFEISPDMSESKQVIYTEFGDIRQAASILIYGGSPSRKWSINAKFISRTPDEADSSWRMVQRLKSWTNPDKNFKYGFDRSIPRVLRLYGYGRTWRGIPVVITSLNVEYPTDVDYIPASYVAEPARVAGQTDEEFENTPNTRYDYGTLVPVIQTVSIQLTEIRNPSELMEKFNLEKFKLGMLENW